MGVTSVILCLVISTASVQAQLTMTWNGTAVTSDTPTLIFHDELFSGTGPINDAGGPGRLVCTSETPAAITWLYTDNSTIGSNFFQRSDGNNPVRSRLSLNPANPINSPITSARENGLWICRESDQVGIYVGLYDRSSGLGRIASNDVELATEDIPNRSFRDNTFTLTGTTTGGPPTTFVWMRNGETITNGGPYIISTRLSDPSSGRATSTYISSLTVTGVPGIYSYSASNRATPNDVTGATIRIEGAAPTSVTARQSGQFQVEVFWTPPSVVPSLGYDVSSNVSGDISAARSPLNITLPSSSEPGYYTIRVRSDSEHVEGLTAELQGFVLKGFLEQVITIESQTRMADSSVLVNISWAPPPLSFQPVGYTVTVSRDDEQTLCSSFEERPQSFSFDLNFTMFTLEAFSNYNVMLMARFNNFDLTPSVMSTVEFVTVSTVPSRAPSLDSNTSTSTSITVTWAEIECIHRNGMITGYVAELRQADGTVVPNMEVVDRTFTASGLQPFTDYNFGVAGMNSEGMGPFLNVTLRTAEDVPGMVPELTAVDQFISVVFSWRAVPADQRNGEIIAYELTFDVNGSMRMENVTNLNTLVFSEDFNVSTSVANISIRAYTNAGPGAERSIDTSIFIPASPTIPVVGGIEVMQVTDSSVMISWERLLTGAVSGYTVYYSQISNRKRQTSEMSKDISADSSSATIEDLVAGESYQFQVTATVTFQGVTTEGTRSIPDSRTMVTIETTTTSPPPTEGPGFPVGIVVGVIVGVLAVVIIIVIIIAIYCIVRSQRRGFHKTYLGPSPDQIELKPSAPSIDDFPEDTETVEGENVVFAVSVNGYPTPNITWYHDGNEFIGDFSREVLDDGSLNIPSAEARHSGVYRMVARNASGSVEQRVRLTVEVTEVLPVKMNLSNNNNNGQLDVST